MTCSDLVDQDTAERYDEISAFMFAPEVVDLPLASSRPNREGAAFKFAMATRRVAIPLADRGVAVDSRARGWTRVPGRGRLQVAPPLVPT